MYNVLDVCRFIINYCDERDYFLSNLKLQKLLYFIQAYFLCYIPSNEGCFKEEIQAWDFGPVVPEAYHEYKKFGNTTIPKVTQYMEVDETDFWTLKISKYSNDKIKLEDQEIIRSVVDKFAQFSTTTLVNITHNQSPWKDAYAQGKNTIITKRSIRRYFNG